jgi:glycosyltransferase involved in cell wall biosynthesis
MCYVVSRWRLRALAAQAPTPAEWPLVTIIVPARDEGEKIEEALTSMLALDYPRFEIIAVDDRSADATGTVMDNLAARDARLRAVHITSLPEGWLGKSHAMHQAAQTARGDWLLFTDGDILFEPEALRLAITHSLHRRIDHLSMNPQLVPGGYWENAVTVCFGLLFFAAFHMWLVPTRWKGAYCGIGAFNLIRAEVYRAVGGFERLRLDVFDDVNMGKLIKQSGYRQQLVFGEDLIRVRWQSSFWGTIRGLEKNSFAIVHYSLTELAINSALFLVLSLAPYGGLCFWPDSAVWGYLGTVLLLHATYGYLAVRAGAGVLVTPVLPLMFVTFLFILWRSAAITLRQGGVRWRDTFYPVAELRRNQLR